MNWERHISNFEVAWTAIRSNTFRAILTALGIIFGVAAVIAMLAIGNGAQKELLDQMKLIGVNNVEIKSYIPEVLPEEQKDNKRFSPGLRFDDVKSIQSVLPNIQKISPEIEIKQTTLANGVKSQNKVIGVGKDYLSIKNFTLFKGQNFSSSHLENAEAVCIVGQSVIVKHFSGQEALGKYIKCGKIWFKIIGILEKKTVSQAAQSDLGIRDLNADIYIPASTFLIRLENRSYVNKYLLDKASENEMDDEDRGGGSSTIEKRNYHQLDKIIVQINNTNQLTQSSQIIARLLKRKHNQVIDFEVSVPELMLKQQKQIKEKFSFLLIAIAAISLIVGGIGIMNIMLASVYERIKEIGLRIALGAFKRDIIFQFVYEAILISITGGVLGVLLGVGISVVASVFFQVETVITILSILISFAVAVGTGLIFGIAPARKAAQQDPITSLRHE